MKTILFVTLILFNFTANFAQGEPQKIYDAEKAFEKAAAEKGVNQAFVEFSAPDAVCFFPGYPVNCREYFKNLAPTTAALFWNPALVDVSSNGAMAYTTGNSIYKPKGEDDPEAFYGQYVTVWQRQPDGRYLAVLDLGISHEKPAVIETKWTFPSDSGKELNEKRISAADVSTQFFEMAAKQDLSRAYKAFLADDIRMLRGGKQPILGRKAALGEYKNFRSKINFAKRTMFVSAADMAYVSNSYTVTDKDGQQTEKGNFLQVWKFRGGKWQIVLDAFLPVSN